MKPPRPSTIGQILAHAGPVAFQLTPTYRLPDVTAIDQAFLRREGIELVIWDVDGTLMGYHARRIAPQFAHQIATLVRWDHAKHAVLSNCDERRFVELGTVIPQMPVFRVYATADAWVTRVRRGDQDTHTDTAVRKLLSAGALHVRKPDPRLVPSVMQALGVADPHRTLVVGDQYLTDVAAARLAGARSAKVDTFEPRTFPLRFRATQAVERIVYGAVDAKAQRCKGAILP